MGATWTDLLDPDRDALERAAPRDLHPRALDMLLAPAEHDDEPRPTLEGHVDYVFGVLLVPVPEPGDDATYYQEIDLVLTREAVVTARKTPPGHDPFDVSPLREAARDESSGMIAYRLANAVAEAYLDVVDALNDEIDELEDKVEEWPPERVRERLSALRHDLLHVRQTLSPTRDAVRRVIDNRIDTQGVELFSRDLELHFADAYDKLLRASEGLELARDLIAGVRDYHQAKVANDQNEVVKRLTVIASVLLLPTFIVGLYGQNLRGVPEFRWHWGYWWSWGLIVVTTVAQIAYFKRKKWI